MLSCRGITTDLLTRTVLKAASTKSDKIYYALLAEKFIAQYSFKMPHSIEDYQQTTQLLRQGLDTKNIYACFYTAKIIEQLGCMSLEELPHSLLLTSLTEVELYQLAEKQGHQESINELKGITAE